MTRAPATLDFAALAAFVHLGRERNFTTVARRLGVTPSAVSKAIARLEADVGAKLVTRNSRSMALTAEGVAFHARCQHVLEQLEDARRAISDPTAPPSGSLRVSLPEGFGRVVIAPRLSEFLRAYPQIDVEILFTDYRLEFIESNLDLAVWTGPLPASRLIARALPSLRYVTCAAPAYLAAHGTPQDVTELDNHVRLGAVGKRTGQLQHWRFIVDGQLVEHAAKPRVQSDSVHALVNLAIDGVGIAQVTDYACEAAIASGRLVPVLDAISRFSTPLNIVYPANARKLSRVRAFSDFILKVVADWRHDRRAPSQLQTA